MFLSLNYYFATGKYQFLLGIESLELVLFAFSALLLVLPSESTLSLDRFLRRIARVQQQT
jgi:hypothetical protein